MIDTPDFDGATAVTIRVRSVAALERAIDVAGGEAALVKRLAEQTPRQPPIERGHLYYWRHKAKNGVPAEHCAAIAAAVADVVTVHELRPDVFARSASLGAAPIATVAALA